METTIFNPTQLFLLQMFERNKDEDSLNELKEALFEFHQKKMAEEGKKVWEAKKLNDDIMDEWLNTHIRTPYRNAQ